MCVFPAATAIIVLMSSSSFSRISIRWPRPCPTQICDSFLSWSFGDVKFFGFVSFVATLIVFLVLRSKGGGHLPATHLRKSRLASFRFFMLSSSISSCFESCSGIRSSISICSSALNWLPDSFIFTAKKRRQRKTCKKNLTSNLRAGDGKIWIADWKLIALWNVKLNWLLWFCWPSWSARKGKFFEQTETETLQGISLHTCHVDVQLNCMISCTNFSLANCTTILHLNFFSSSARSINSLSCDKVLGLTASSIVCTWINFHGIEKNSRKERWNRKRARAKSGRKIYNIFMLSCNTQRNYTAPRRGEGLKNNCILWHITKDLCFLLSCFEKLFRCSSCSVHIFMCRRRERESFLMPSHCKIKYFRVFIAIDRYRKIYQSECSMRLWGAVRDRRRWARGCIPGCIFGFQALQPRCGLCRLAAGAGATTLWGCYRLRGCFHLW